MEVKEKPESKRRIRRIRCFRQGRKVLRKR